MLISIDPTDAAPLHEQVARAVRRAVQDGDLTPGDRLPPAKELAAQLDINPNTVLRALRGLRDEGLLEFRRGRGVHVTGTARPQSTLDDLIDRLLSEGRRLGYSAADLARLIERRPS
ncbi:GntR family transcriptional regulator [Salininema proteolyticum]|uniref:GntR family transcriptional regulator n=1 Tax=Salininema proteolyticum TaxID=1607685 RepID=A0ABV8TZC0_9ACTN